MNLSLSNEKTSKASQTWGYRRRILLSLAEQMDHQGNDFEALREFWQSSDSHEAMVEKLTHSPAVETLKTPE